MKKFIIISIILVTELVFLSFANGSNAIQREDLLFQPVPIVVTAARYEQPISESPSTISIITEADIKLSGATTIPELLRAVPGLDINIQSASNVNVSIRGQGGLMPHNILVMIDGRSVYEDFFAVTVWDSLPITLDDIKRIEIIRGPGAALYGANAFAGVINIITKKPEDIKRPSLGAVYGEHATTLGSFLIAQDNERTGYKLSVGYDAANSWQDPSTEDKKFNKANFFWQAKPIKGHKLTLSTGYNNGKGNLVFPPIFGTSEALGYDSNVSYLEVAYELPDFYVKSFLNSRTAVLDKFFSLPGNYNIYVNTFDLRSQRSFKSANNILIWGGNTRLNKGTASLLGGEHREFLWSTYLQNETRLRNDLILTLGARYDNHPLVKAHFSPRASLVYLLDSKRVVRFSAGTAFRNPSFLESYLDATIDIAPGISTRVTGNENLKPESLTQYEISYQADLLDRASGKFDLFYNDTTNLIELTPISYNPPPFNVIPSLISATNLGSYIIQGGEATFTIPIAGELSSQFNYSYQYATTKSTGAPYLSMPKHKANVILKYQPVGFSAYLLVFYQSSIQNVFGTAAAFTQANLTLRKSLTDDIWATLAAFNLLSQEHREYPAAILVGRRVTLSLNINL